jgi:hypothetical protein
MRLLVLFGCALALAGADTLDIGRQAIVVTMLSSGSAQGDAGAAAARRAEQLVRAATRDRNLTVGQFLATSPAAARRFDRLSWEGRIAGTRYLSDGTVATDYEFRATGPLLAAIAPATGYGRIVGRGACPCCGREWPEGRPVPDSVRLAPLDAAGGWTGILIDVRGLAPAPALFPRVITEDDAEVIGPGFAAPEDLNDVGQFGCYQTQFAATTSKRIGPNPLLVRALRAAGTTNCDIVVSRSDAARIHGSAANLKLLEQCRVGLLID